MADGRKRVPRRERERQMLASGMHAFGKRGYASTSMDEVAAQVGVTKPMLYAYFGSKQGLYEACIEHAAASISDRLEEAVDRASSDPAEQTRAGVRALFDFVAFEPDAWRLLHQGRVERSGPSGELFERERGRIATALSKLLADAAEEAGLGEAVIGTVEPFAHGMMGAAEALAELWNQRGGERELYELALMNLIWQGLGQIVRGALWRSDGTAPSARGLPA